jgi:ABC-type branched-subunit amino acid transport system substrate-binding protein
VKGGVAGNKINLTVVDHGYKVPEAVKFVKKFCTQDKVDMLATWDAGSGLMCKPIFQKYMVPDINYSTPSAFLRPPIDYAYLPFGNYDMDSYAIMEYIKNIHTGGGAPKVGLLTYNNAYGKCVHKPATEAAAKFKIELVGIEAFPPAGKQDLKTELLRLQKAGAQYVMTQILPSHVIMALQSADQISYDIPFIGTWTTTDPTFFERAKGLLRGRLFAQFCGCLPGDNSEGTKLIQGLMDRYGTVKKFDFSYWEGVVIASIMERAFQRAAEKFGKINGQTINQALQTFRNEDFGGLVPNITYTNTDHSASWKGRIVRLNEDQTYTPMTSFWAPGREKVKILR